jgi:hypothetical protein
MGSWQHMLRESECPARSFGSDLLFQPPAVEKPDGRSPEAGS